MKNTFGQSVAITLFGESHGQAIGAVLDGLAPGIKIDEDYIRTRLSLRSARSNISTPRSETDQFKFVSGIHNGVTTGTPIGIIIPNMDIRSKDYQRTEHLLRPGHADYAAYTKYHGYQDIRGGGHFSGRITAALVCAGAICMYALEQKNIFIGTHIKECAGISDDTFVDFRQNASALKQQVKDVSTKLFPVLNNAKGELMQQAILNAKKESDSVGGILETCVLGIDAGLGEPWFDTLESIIAHGLFSIPAVKGVSFGLGFDFAVRKGSQVNDSPVMLDGKITFLSNYNGGINGGISNGMPLLYQTVIKPTSSISKPQPTVDILQKKNAILEIHGRHDPAIVHRAREVVNAMTALILCDVYALRYGTDWIVNEI
ncbi:MAG TPA: chorismate synthase [Clostridiaceae bacterium]|nr:chorismate synthase [Clostridiaceae bacterium]